VVIGISADNIGNQQKFTDVNKLPFPLFADPDKTVIKAYGALSPRGFANRYTFVIDKKGVLRKAYTKVSAAKHAEEVLAFVKKELAAEK
jgi:peroxiredoxin Q/BCP